MTTSDVLYLQWLIRECGYRDPRPVGGGRYAAISPFLFTCAVVTGHVGDKIGIDDRWCYHDYPSAKAALDAWDGQGEPAGWHRHPATGRRVSLDASEVDEGGQVVGIVGGSYVRE